MTPAFAPTILGRFQWLPDGNGRGMAEETSVTIRISSRVGLVDMVHSAAEKMARFSGLGQDDALNVGIAVREGVINAIVHGNGNDPGKIVEIRLFADAGRLEMRILDQGEGFDESAAPDPTVGAALLATSGRGLLMMRAYVDEVEQRSADGGGCMVVLTKNLGGA